MRIEVVHGPNLNLLGEREPEIYGSSTLAQIDTRLGALGRELGVEVSSFQSNHEGAIIDHLQARRFVVDAFILNLAGYTHTSVALRDAVLAIGRPAVEVHLSNPHAREGFRHTSLLADVVAGVIQGFGPLGYELALRALVEQAQGRLAAASGRRATAAQSSSPTPETTGPTQES